MCRLFGRHAGTTAVKATSAMPASLRPIWIPTWPARSSPRPDLTFLGRAASTRKTNIRADKGSRR